MKLTPTQIDTFNREGWLFLPELFSPEEIEVLREEAANVLASNRQEIWREKSGAPRTAFAAHTYNEAFGDPRPASAHDQSRRAGVRRKGLHAPVQDQREG